MRTFSDIEQNVLATQFEGYKPRTAQQQVARFIEERIADGGHGLIQAPVGTGKSFGALIPAINYVIANPGKRVLIPTATNLLAHQYYEKDIPALLKMYEEILGETFTYAMVKGRAHYVCQWELSENSENESAVRIIEELNQNPNHSGDFEDFSFSVPQGDRSALSISSAECPGLKSCKIGRTLGCFSNQARDRAQTAQIVVTNISALVTNAKMMGNLLGEFDLTIVDEGHNVDNYALGSMEEILNFDGLRRLINQSDEFYPLSRKEEILASIDQMEADAMEMIGEESFMKITEQNIMDHIGPFIPVYQALNDLKGRLSGIANAANESLEDMPDEGEETSLFSYQARNAKKLAKQASNYVSVLNMLLPLGDDDENDEETINIGAGLDHVRWISSYEVKRRNKGRTETSRRVRYHTCPIEVAGFMRRFIWNGTDQYTPSPTIMMSGTMAPGGDFSYIKRTLGAPKDIPTIKVDSPFDFKRQGMLFVPDGRTPAPQGLEYEDWFDWYISTTEEMVKASKGDALLLFTSRKNMEAAYERLAPVFQRFGYKCYIQNGEMTPGEISKEFMDMPGSVLFGLKSFFEGFDPKKGKVKVLILDKLPFPVPTDIIFEARSQKLNHEMSDGYASFRMLTIPLMSLVLDQAVGRLIRSDEHEGVVCLMDSRLTTKGYGRKAVNALPPFSRARYVHEVTERLEELVS